MAEDAKRTCVLVIDKGRGILDFIAERILLPNGYKPILARDGVEGVRMALAHVPDLIIMDHALPKLSGVEVLEALHTRPLQIPVILMTSLDAQQIDVKLLRMGVRDYIVKPFTVDQMLQSIRRVTFEVQLRREKTDLAHRLAHAERKVKQCLIELTIFHKVSEAVKNRLPLDVLLERVTEAALFVTQSEECVLALNDPETGDRTEKARKRRTRGAARPLVPNMPPASDQSGTVIAMLHAPLKVGSRELGVLRVNNKTTLRSFGDHERQMLSILADYAAIAIEMVRLTHQLERVANVDPKS